MGASESIPIPQNLTHERLFEETRNTRDIMNLILQYMLKEVTVKDFLALSNPNECKKYVLFMANTLHKYFYELQIQPFKDRGGVIAFRSIRDLATPSEETDREKQSLCLILAYYYTRIFQIYGALALTLIDDISTMRESGMASSGQRKGLIAPGQRQMIYGGALTASELGKFAFLRSFLRDEKEQYGYRALYQPQQGIDGDIFFSIKTDAPVPTNTFVVPTTSSQKGVFTFAYEGAKHYSTIDVHVERSSSSSSSSSSSLYGTAPTSVTAIRVSFSNFQYIKKGETSLTHEEIPSTYLPRSLPLLYPTTLGDGQTVYTFREINKSVNEFLQDYFYRLLRFTKSLIEERKKLNSSSSSYSTTGKTDNTSKSGPSADVLKQLSASEDDTIEQLRLGKIIHNLYYTKPYGHCIARALQLLDTVPYPNQSAISHICKAKFLEVSGTSEKGTSTRFSRSGIPEPGSDLTSSPGILALSMLFYDTIAIGTPKLDINQRPGPSGRSTLEQYVEFMIRMAKNFGDYYRTPPLSDARSDDSLREKGLSGIKNRRDKLFCKDHDGDIMIPYATAKNVYGVVQSLFKEQLEHSSECGKIFSMLFHIQKDKSSGRVAISLNENILIKGVMEINRINYIARNQLMKYYTNCEEKYMDGMKLVIDSKSREKEASQPPPAPPAPPAPAPPALKNHTSNKFENVSKFISTFPTPASKASVAEARAKGIIPPAASKIIPASKASVAIAQAKGALPPPSKKSVRFHT